MTVSNELIDCLLADYKKPEDLIGENGLIKQVTSTQATKLQTQQQQMAPHLH
jgi:putative transposase